MDSWKLPLSVVIMGQMSREITWLNLHLFVCVCMCVCLCNHLCPFLAVVNIAGLCESELCDDRCSLSVGLFEVRWFGTATWPHVVAALIKTSAAYNYGFVVAFPSPQSPVSSRSSRLQSLSQSILRLSDSRLSQMQFVQLRFSVVFFHKS